MKKLLTAISKVLVFILLLPFLLITGVVLLLRLPFDYVAYKRSFYYRDYGLKYTFLAGMSAYIKLYEIIRRASLPIQYVRAPENGEVYAMHGYGYFLRHEVLILPDLGAVWYEDGDWCMETGEKCSKLTDVMRETLEEARAAMQNEGCRRAVILQKRQALSYEDAERAENDELILLYDGKHPEKALKTYAGRLDAE